MTKSLRSSSRSGMIWSFLIQGGTQLINFIVTIILARLLLPEQFGLIGMIAIFIAISRSLVDGGFVSSLIRTKNVDNEDYSTVFYTNLVSSCILYALLYLSAPALSAFFNEDILLNMVRVLGLVLILNALSIVQSTKLNKELNFKAQFKLQLPSLIISAVVSIWMAYNSYGVWSLVAKDIVYALVATLQLWWYAKWTPSFIFNKEKFIYHFNFGYKLSLAQIINTGFDNLYNVIIGKYFSAAQLGFYTRARSLEQLPSGFFFNAFNRVFYPLLAQVNDDNDKLKEIYSRLMKAVIFIVTPILVYLGIIAEPFIRLLMTDKWLPAVPYFQLLLISGIFFPIYKYNLNISNLKGRSDLVLKLSMLQNILLLIGATSAVWFGIYGLLYSLIGVNVFLTFVNAHFSGKLISYDLKHQMKDFGPIVILSIFTGTVLFFLQFTWFFKWNDLPNLVTSAVIFGVLYILIALTLRMSVINDLLGHLKKEL